MKSVPFLLLLFLATGCFTREVADPLASSIDSIMTSVADTARFNGNVLVARNGKVIYQRSFGWANFDTKEPLNDSSLFDLASVSKQFTAMAIVMLKEQGKLSYEDDVRKYLPELSGEGMTIRHFLTHTSGISGYMDSERPIQWEPRINYNADVLAMLAKAKQPGYFAPGEQWVYSNTAYVLLAIIIERVSGKPYGEFLKEEIFMPLGMTRSRVYNTFYSGEIIPNYAYGYIYSDSLSKFIRPDSIPSFHFMYTLSGVQGDGSVNSTTTDLFKWNEALYTEKLISQASLSEAFTPTTLNNGSTYPYGFGWRIEKDSILGRIVRHSGGWPGVSTQIRRYIDRKDCLIVLSNAEGYGRATIVREIEDRLRKAVQR